MKGVLAGTTTKKLQDVLEAAFCEEGVEDGCRVICLTITLIHRMATTRVTQEYTHIIRL